MSRKVFKVAVPDEVRNIKDRWDNNPPIENLYMMVDYITVQFPKALHNILLYLMPIFIWILYRQEIGVLSNKGFAVITVIALIGAFWKGLDAVD